MTIGNLQPTNRFNRKLWVLLLLTVLSIFWVPIGKAGPLAVWQRNEVPFVLTPSLYQVTYGNEVFVVTGDSGTLLVSHNGTDWFWQVAPFSSDSGPLFFLNGLFFSHSPFSTSSDGVTWTNHLQFERPVWHMTYGNNVFVGQSDTGLRFSHDGIRWTNSMAVDPSLQIDGLAFGNNVFVAVGNGRLGTAYGGVILTSVDGRGWTFRRFVEQETPQRVTFGNGRFLVQGRFGESSDGVNTNLLISTDGLAWRPASLPAWVNSDPESSPRMAFGGGLFVLAAANGTNDNLVFLSSSDGDTWTADDMGTNYNLVSINYLAYGNGTFVAVGQDQTSSGVILQSATVSTDPSAEPTLDLRTYPGLTVTGTVGRVYRIECSSDVQGTEGWQTVTNITLLNSPYLWVDPRGLNKTRHFYRVVAR